MFVWLKQWFKTPKHNVLVDNKSVLKTDDYDKAIAKVTSLEKDPDLIKYSLVLLVNNKIKLCKFMRSTGKLI